MLTFVSSPVLLGNRPGMHCAVQSDCFSYCSFCHYWYATVRQWMFFSQAEENYWFHCTTYCCLIFSVRDSMLHGMFARISIAISIDRWSICDHTRGVSHKPSNPFLCAPLYQTPFCRTWNERPPIWRTIQAIQVAGSSTDQATSPSPVRPPTLALKSSSATVRSITCLKRWQIALLFSLMLILFITLPYLLPRINSHCTRTSRSDEVALTPLRTTMQRWMVAAQRRPEHPQRPHHQCTKVVGRLSSPDGLRMPTGPVVLRSTLGSTALLKVPLMVLT